MSAGNGNVILTVADDAGPHDVASLVFGAVLVATLAWALSMEGRRRRLGP